MSGGDAHRLELRAAGPLGPLVRRLRDDRLFRQSFLLLANVGVLSGLGFVFWTLAARLYPTGDVGVFAGWTSAANLLAAFAGLGLATTLMRELGLHAEPRRLAATALVLVGTVGVVASAVAMLALAPIAPGALHLGEARGELLVVLALVVVSAIGGLVDAALIAADRTGALIAKNVVGGVVRFAGLWPLSGLGATGILVTYTAGAALAALIAWLVLRRALAAPGGARPSLAALRPFLRLSTGTYVGGIVGILPMTVVPLIVLGALGAQAAAHFQVAFLVASLLAFVPSTVAQAYLAHAARHLERIGREALRALRGIYGVLLPAIAVFVLAAPLVLRIFGGGYAAASVGPTRILALATLATAVTYLVDAVLNVQRRAVAFAAMNAINAALVLGCVAVGSRSGLDGIAWGWLVGQAASAVIGVVLVRAGRVVEA